ncbi:MAG: DUF4011 domain-containing protein [Candidatus Nanohaloarchaea archaeon]
MTDFDKKIENWKEKLLDLTRRNKMVHFKPTKTKSLPLKGRNKSEIKELFLDEETIFVRKPETKIEEDEEETEDRRDVEEDEIEGNEVLPTRNLEDSDYSLNQLFLNQRSILQEKGVDPLYISMGMMRWFEAESSDEVLRSPLILVPVEIERKTNENPERYNYEINYEEEEVLINPALRKKLSDERGIELPDDEDVVLEDLEEIFESVRSKINGFPRWEIKEKIILGIFQFANIGLYNDLDKNREAIKENSVVKAMNDDLEDLDTDLSDVPSQEELDDKVNPSDTFQVLDADPSQRVAIEAAKSGKSFVLQGPPGTGKSQTITNIIAEKMAVGEKVLFVSQKKAALDVVKNRLEEVGLGRFCLEVHGRKANKNKVLKSIESEMKSQAVRNGKNREEQLQELKTKRHRLNNYGEVLHTEFGEIGTTPYEAHGKVAINDDLPRVNLDIENPLEISSRDFNEMKESVRELAQYEYEIKNYNDHPWKFSTIDSWKMNTSENIRDLIEDQRSILSRIQESSEEVQEEIEVCPRTINEFKNIAEFLEVLRERPEVSWRKSLLSKDLVEMKDSILEFSEVMKELRDLKSELESNYRDSLFDEDAEELLDELEEYGISRYVSPSYRSLKKNILNHAKQEYSPGYSDLKADLEKLERIQELQQLREDFQTEKDLIKGLYDGLTTNWDDVKSVLDWLERLYAREELFNQAVKEKIIRNDLDITLVEKIEGLHSEWVEVEKKFGQVADLDEIRVAGNSFYQTKFTELDEFLENLEGQLSKLKEWVQFRNEFENIDRKFLKEFLESSFEKNVEPKNLVKIFEKQFFSTFLDEIYEQNDLGGFNSRKFNQLVEDFRELDKKQEELAIREIQHRVTSRKPKMDLEHAKSSEQVFLKREINKQRRHKPLRVLFERSSNIITELKPCFMMSPLSVAQYLQLDSVEFDTVIFDEASQIEPQEAISSIIRADQAIVVGDTKQLPPTRFFKADVEDKEDVREDLESILDETASVLPEKYLLWHYRSKDEELISFSNHQYYDNRLKTFPSNDPETETGVDFQYVEDGVYDRGKSSKNRIEAERVVDRIEKHVENKPDKSLGIVAFSTSQQEAIREALADRRKDNPALEEFISKDQGIEDFFIKNLETVQGDERDVILFSIGYGPDEQGRINMNFGPLNSEGGERRLNVAVTRAKEKVDVISSLLPGELDVGRVSNVGPQHFKKYLEYAKAEKPSQVLERDQSYSSNLEFDSEFEEAVYDELESQGYDVVTQVESSGYSIDLAIKHPENPGKFILGIECDGAAYHSTKTARERDRLRQHVLEDLGWEIHRIWSTDWARNKREQVKKIDKKIEDLLNGESEEQKIDSDFNPDEYEEIELEKLEGLHNDIEDYKEPEINQNSDRDFDNIRSSTLKKALNRIVKKYGPISRDEAYNLVAQKWQFSHAGQRITRKLDSQVSISSNIKSKDGFLWHKDMDNLKIRINTDDSQRDIQNIPLEELAKASYVILENGYRIKRDDLILETARLYGFQRNGERIKKRIGKAIDKLEASNQIKERNDYLEITEEKDLSESIPI